MIKILTVYGGMLIGAMGRTLLLALLGLFFACIIGLIFGLLGVIKNRACNIIAQIFVDIVRGVPMIVLAFFVYFGVPYFFNTIIGTTGMTLTALQAGTICLALNCGRYSVRRCGTDGGSPFSRSFLWNVYEKGSSSSGNPYDDSYFYQSIYYYLKGHLDFVRYRFSGTC